MGELTIGAVTTVSCTIGATATGSEKMAPESSEWARIPASP